MHQVFLLLLYSSSSSCFHPAFGNRLPRCQSFSLNATIHIIKCATHLLPGSPIFSSCFIYNLSFSSSFFLSFFSLDEHNKFISFFLFHRVLFLFIFFFFRTNLAPGSRKSRRQMTHQFCAAALFCFSKKKKLTSLKKRNWIAIRENKSKPKNEECCAGASPYIYV